MILSKRFWIKVEQELTVSQVEKDKFCFSGLDVNAVEDYIKISMNDYMQSLKDIKEIHNVDHDEKLSKLEMKEYQK